MVMEFSATGFSKFILPIVSDPKLYQSLMVIPHCSFVRQHIAARPDQYLALVPADRRAQFDLPAA